MGDQGKIIAGLIIFLILATFPIWYTVGSSGDVSLPNRGPAKDGSSCIEADMVAKHMDILNQWRSDVVRGDGTKQYYDSEYLQERSPGHEPYEKSLTKTCMKCHGIESRSNGIISCSECHVYANVELTCWDCHVDAKGN
ncbi:MAG: sulfate reduction electron transfer complex DsrMKJOP subunit DsrJ [Planctomycetes bacterium]|nr:sulfate reduction electron transfer complex DsrMKJOP subunit DsrJ [Planctomycetota bacterium]